MASSQLLNRQPQHLSKILGALLGVHSGDSLGASFEFMRHSQILSRYPNGLRSIIGGGPFSWPAGHATDDTDLTRAVLLSYRDRTTHLSQGKKPEDFDIVKSAADYSLAWFQGENWPGRKPGEQPRDIGGATYDGLKKYERSRDPKNCGAGIGRAGNGSLMRCIPSALFSSSRADRVKESIEISAITHDDVRCTIACAAYNEIVAALVEGKSVEEALMVGEDTSEKLECPAVTDAIRKGSTVRVKDMAEQGPGPDFPNSTSGFVLQSLTVAVSALLDPRSFEDVLVDVVRIGGDTDTNGAISGGLLGARDGVERIPEKWLEVLQFRKEFEDVARNILEMKH